MASTRTTMRLLHRAVIQTHLSTSRNRTIASVTLAHNPAFQFSQSKSMTTQTLTTMARSAPSPSPKFASVAKTSSAPAPAMRRIATATAISSANTSQATVTVYPRRSPKYLAQSMSILGSSSFATFTQLSKRSLRRKKKTPKICRDVL